MSAFPQVLVFDRDSVLNVASYNPQSPLYYITRPDHLILKPYVRKAIKVAQLASRWAPMILATKQRCISKGIATRQEVDEVNEALEAMLDIQFTHILVEETAEDKTALFKRIVQLYPKVHSRRIVAFDDSQEERNVAYREGLTAYDGSDLWAGVCAAFNIKA